MDGGRNQGRVNPRGSPRANSLHFSGAATDALRASSGVRNAEKQEPDSGSQAIATRLTQRGRTYFLSNGREAFRDYESRLTTRSAAPALIRELIRLGADRGFGAVRATGNARFKREVRRAARLAGLDLIEQPTKSRAQRSPSTRTRSETEMANSVADPRIEASDRETFSRFSGAGSPEPPSRTELASINRIPAAESLDDRASAAHVLRDENQAPLGAVRAYPELTQSYLALHAADLLAQRQRASASTRRQFVRAVRDRLAAQVEQGDSLPRIRLIERANARAPLPRSVRDSERDLARG
jgi:hypothetical protein